MHISFKFDIVYVLYVAYISKQELINNVISKTYIPSIHFSKEHPEQNAI